MTDQDADTNSNPSDSEKILLGDGIYIQNSELNDKQIVQFPQQDNPEIELKKIEIERKHLELERERFLLEHEKAKFEIELKRERNELELESSRSLIQLNDLRDSQEISHRERIESRRHQHQQDNRSYWFRMSISTVLIASGIWLIYRGDNLGPYLLGTGAGGAGIQSASELVPKRKKEDLESSVSDSDNKETELGA